MRFSRTGNLFLLFFFFNNSFVEIFVYYEIHLSVELGVWLVY